MEDEREQRVEELIMVHLSRRVGSRVSDEDIQQDLQDLSEDP